jgi:hypothetical protein
MRWLKGNDMLAKGRIEDGDGEEVGEMCGGSGKGKREAGWCMKGSRRYYHSFRFACKW